MSNVDITVRELVDKVQSKELTLPEMQRRYIWPATRVRDLLDSLYRGYPSGMILVWQTDEDIINRGLAVDTSSITPFSSKLLLLDGQQRITSLFCTLEGKPVFVRHRKRPIDILFNLEHPEGPPVEITEVEENGEVSEVDEEDDDSTELSIQEELKKRTFVVASHALKNDPLWVPVSDVFKKTESQILKPIGINSDDPRWDKYSERLKKLKKIEDYQYRMQVLDKNLSYEEVTEIFVRVNSLGVKLRGSDLALAQITSRWKGFMNLIENFTNEFGDDSDYLIESGLPVRALVVFATNQCRFKTVGKINKELLEKSWDDATKGMRFAINFIRSNAKIESLIYLSSPLLLLPIAVFSKIKNEEITKDEEKKMLKWLYIAHMRGHYGMGSSESILDLDLSTLLKNNRLEDIINQLQVHIKKFNVESIDIANKGIRSAFFSMLYFVLREKNAKDWTSGLFLSDKHVGRSHYLQYHHIFPKSLLKKRNIDQKEINEISNIAFISGQTNRRIFTDEPKDYFKDIIAQRGEDALKSQLIPFDRELWDIKNYHQFIEYRRKLIADEINTFMKQFE